MPNKIATENLNDATSSTNARLIQQRNVTDYPDDISSDKRLEYAKNYCNKTSPSHDVVTTESTYLQALCLGDKNAAFKLGLFYYEYKSDKFKLRRAYEYFKIAAESGIIEAYRYIAIQNYYGIGVQQNECEAFKNAYTAVTLGFKQANLILGLCYYHGCGVRLDLKKAFKCFKHQPDCDERANNMAICYILGKGTPANIGAGIKLLESHNSSPICMYTLAQCYEIGCGVQQSITKAKKLLKDSCAMGFQPSAIKFYRLLDDKHKNIQSLKKLVSMKTANHYDCYITVDDDALLNTFTHFEDDNAVLRYIADKAYQNKTVINGDYLIVNRKPRANAKHLR